MVENIEVYGLDKNLTVKAILCYCDILGIECPKIQIGINETLPTYVRGKMYRVEDDEFIIFLKPFKDFAHITEMYQTIAHEMVHVKQYIKDNLLNDLKEKDLIPYHERWWEIEAFRLQSKMVQIFTERMRKNVCS